MVPIVVLCACFAGEVFTKMIVINSCFYPGEQENTRQYNRTNICLAVRGSSKKGASWEVKIRSASVNSEVWGQLNVARTGLVVN